MTANSIFENFFDSEKITPTRLYNFAASTINRMKGDATTGQLWTTILPEIENAANVLGTELGEVDTATNIRMGATDTVDETLHSFSQYLLENEPFIARAVGGKDKPAFLEFYPSGTHEYTRVNKTTAPLLLSRIAAAAQKYNAQLGAQLASDLQQYASIYDTQRDEQQGHKGAVEENRSQRSDARKKLELVLMKAVFEVGQNFPGDVARCKVFFEFERLYRHSADAGNEGS